MEEYGKDGDQKVIIDDLQIYYGFCGANNYKDRFLIKWVPNGYRKGHPTNKSGFSKFVAPIVVEWGIDWEIKNILKYKVSNCTKQQYGATYFLKTF